MVLLTKTFITSPLMFLQHQILMKHIIGELCALSYRLGILKRFALSILVMFLSLSDIEIRSKLLQGMGKKIVGREQQPQKTNRINLWGGERNWIFSCLDPL